MCVIYVMLLFLLFFSLSFSLLKICLCICSCSGSLLLCTGAFSSCGFLCRLALIAVHKSSSLHWLLLSQSTGFGYPGFGSCSVWAQQLQHTGLVDPKHMKSSRPGIEPVSPALVGRFLTTRPPGKPLLIAFLLRCFLRTRYLCVLLNLCAVDSNLYKTFVSLSGAVPYSHWGCR